MDALARYFCVLLSPPTAAGEKLTKEETGHLIMLSTSARAIDYCAQRAVKGASKHRNKTSYIKRGKSLRLPPSAEKERR